MFIFLESTITLAPARYDGRLGTQLGYRFNAGCFCALWVGKVNDQTEAINLFRMSNISTVIEHLNCWYVPLMTEISKYGNRNSISNTIFDRISHQKWHEKCDFYCVSFILASVIFVRYLRSKQWKLKTVCFRSYEKFWTSGDARKLKGNHFEFRLLYATRNSVLSY